MAQAQARKPDPREAEGAACAGAALSPRVAPPLCPRCVGRRRHGLGSGPLRTASRSTPLNGRRRGQARRDLNPACFRSEHQVPVHVDSFAFCSDVECNCDHARQLRLRLRALRERPSSCVRSAQEQSVFGPPAAAQCPRAPARNHSQRSITTANSA